MDKFITHAGQQPIFLGDIDFFDKAVRDTFIRTVKVMSRGEDNAILSGFEYTFDSSQGVTKIVWTAGVVMLGGEILPIDAGAAKLAVDQNFRFVIETSYDETGRRMMKDGDMVDCYEIRKATVTGTTVYPDENWIVTDVRRIDEIYADFIKSVNTETTIVNSSGESLSDMNISFRLYRIGASYYINGNFELTSPHSGLNRYFYGVNVRQPAVTDDDIRNLTTATMYPSGMTMFPITLFQESGNLYEYKVIPASVSIKQFSTPAKGISVSIYVREDLEEGLSGSFFTRLNTL